MMDPILHAGRALGRALVLHGVRENGSRYLAEAASDLQRSKIKALAGEANKLRQMASNWKWGANQIPTIFESIQNQRGKTYHAVSCGFLMGLAMEACLKAGRDTDLPTTKTELVDWLVGAKEHSGALKDQHFVPNMPNFEGKFNRIITAIRSADSSLQLRNASQLIEDLSNKVGNAIG